jgi:prophage DNA circulation protein
VNLDEVLSGKFKDVPFLMTSGQVSGGNKNVVHSYPNSDRQTVENLGRTPRSFPITILLPSFEYTARRDVLLLVLEEKTPGVLIHPFHGRIENAIAGPYTLSEDFTSLGSGTIQVTFLIDNGPGVPQAAGITASAVAKANQLASQAIQTNFSSAYHVTPGFLGSFESATESVRDAALAFQKSQAPLDQASEYLTAAEALAAESAALITAPINLALRITDMFERATTLFDDPVNALKHFSGYFGFGDSMTAKVPVTAAQIEVANNKALFDSAMKTQALGYAYQSIVQVEFSTVEDVDSASLALEEQYLAVRDAEGVDTDSRELLSDLRELANQLLDDQKLTARRIVTVRTHPTTARLLAFSYYGNDEQGEAIADINGNGVSNLSGYVKVLTA